MAEFGNDSKDIQKGWLTSETVVQLKIFGEKALNIWREEKEFSIKVTPVKANWNEVNSSETKWGQEIWGLIKWNKWKQVKSNEI